MKIIYHKKRVLLTRWAHSKYGAHRGDGPETRGVLFFHVGPFSLALG